MIYEVLAATVGTVAFSVLFDVPRKYYVHCGVIGGTGWLVYSLLIRWLSVAEATLFATMAVIILSRQSAVAERCPVTIFLISGIFPLVPGAGVYWTSYYIVTNQLDLAAEKGFLALKVAVAIVLGIVSVFELPQNIFCFLPKAIDRYRQK